MSQEWIASRCFFEGVDILLLERAARAPIRMAPRRLVSAHLERRLEPPAQELGDDAKAVAFLELAFCVLTHFQDQVRPLRQVLRIGHVGEDLLWGSVYLHALFAAHRWFFLLPDPPQGTGHSFSSVHMMPPVDTPRKGNSHRGLLLVRSGVTERHAHGFWTGPCELPRTPFERSPTSENYPSTHSAE